MRHASGHFILRSILVLTVACFAAFAVSAQSIISASSWWDAGYSRQLVVVDPATGALLAGRDVNVTSWAAPYWRILAIATDPTSGTIYSIIDNWGDPTYLATIEPVTGDATLIGPTTQYLASIAFASDGTLYGITSWGSDVPAELYAIDTSTGATTLACTDPLDATGDRPAIAFSSDGLLYHASGRGTATFESLTPTDPCIQTDVPLTGYMMDEGIQGLLDIGGSTFLAGNQYELFTVTTGGVVTYIAYHGFPGWEGLGYDALHGFATTSATLPVKETSVTQTLNPTAIDVGDNFVATITVTNEDTSDATSVKSQTFLQPYYGLSYVSSSSADATCVEDAAFPSVICDFGTLAAGAIATAELTLSTTFSGYAAGSYVRTGLTHDDWELDPNDNLAAQYIWRARANLGVTTTAVGRMGHAGKAFTFHVTATNAGPNSAEAVSVTSAVPGTTFSSSTLAGCTGWTCSLGNLYSGQTVEYDVIVLAGAGKTTMTHTATISSTTWDDVTSNNTASAGPIKVVGKP